MEKIIPQQEDVAEDIPAPGQLALSAGGVEVPAGLQKTMDKLAATTPASEVDAEIHGAYADNASRGAAYWLEQARDTSAPLKDRQRAGAEYRAQMDAARGYAALEQGAFDPANVQVTQEQVDKVQRMNLQ